LRVTTESLRDIAGSINSAVGDPGTQAGLRSALTQHQRHNGQHRAATANLADVTGGFKTWLATRSCSATERKLPPT
jgi:hypothetical protein